MKGGPVSLTPGAVQLAYVMVQRLPHPWGGLHHVSFPSRPPVRTGSLALSWQLWGLEGTGAAQDEGTAELRVETLSISQAQGHQSQSAASQVIDN